MNENQLLAALARAVGDRHLIVDPAARAAYETDWTGRFHGRAAAVARPGSAREVAAVLRACARHRTAVVPQAGNTGLVGASVPRGGEVVLSLARLDAIGDPDPATLEVEAGAGVTLEALGERALAAGLDPGLDLASRGSATLGGIAACDAGGARALRHGTARRRVGSVEAVLADGTVIAPARAPKDNAGFDLGSLLVGSEGTLGVITRVGWRLVPAPRHRSAALVGLGSFDDAVALLGVLRPRLPSLEACEVMTAEGLELVFEHLGVRAPLAGRPPVQLLIECAGAGDPAGELAAALDRAGASELAVAAVDSHDRERLWRLREAHTEAIASAGDPRKLDVAVAPRRLGELAARLPAAVEAAAPGARAVVFGHLADGNLHVNVLGVESGRGDAVDEAVLRLVAGCGGTVSAEHGIGVAKARWLGLVRSSGEIEAMRRVKRALDPGGLLNPGAVLAD